MVADWIRRLSPWRAYRQAGGWPETTPPTVPPTGPPNFDLRGLPADSDVVMRLCPDCGHEESEHPRAGQQNLNHCRVCLWEEDNRRRDAEDICPRRFPGSA